MDNPIALNSPQYAIPNLTTTSQQVILEENLGNLTRVVIDNTEGSSPVFVTASASSATAVFPTSLTVGSMGSVVGAGTVQTYMIKPTDRYFAAIRSSGTANLYLMFGSGE